MAVPLATEQMWRFGIFEVDGHRQEIRRAGVPIKLREQSFRILLLLLEHANEVVTREDLRKVLWPSDTFVDFEHSLNAAVMKLREALGDSAEKPLYIETIPKHGYRFIAPLAVNTSRATASGVEQSAGAQAEADATPALAEPAKAVAPVPAQGWSRGRLLWRWVATLALAAIAVAVWYVRRPLPQLRITSYTRLTNAAGTKFPIGTDGHVVFLEVNNPFSIATVAVSGGQLTPMAIDLPSATDFPDTVNYLIAVSPDGSGLLVGSNLSNAGRDLWYVGVQGRPARYLTRVRDATFSPDGRTVLYSNAHGDLYTMPSAGGDSHLLLRSPAPSGKLIRVHSLRWSPHGDKIRYVLDTRYWEISPNGSDAHELLPAWHSTASKYWMCCGAWTPDQAFFLFSAGEVGFASDLSKQSQIWVLDDRRRASAHAFSSPVQLTATIISSSSPIVSGDGKTIFARGAIVRGELLIHNMKSNLFLPYLGGISAEFVDFSKDGK